MRKLGRVERVVFDWIQSRGPTRPHELHGTVKNPERVLRRLTQLGVLLHQQRGVYEIPVSSLDRLEEIRARATEVPHAAPRAELGMPSRRIRKGARLVASKDKPLPGDVVLSNGRLGILRGHVYAPNMTLPKAYKVELAAGRHVEEKACPTKVVACFMRCTKAAAERRAKEPHVKAPPPSSPLWWTPPKEAT